MDRKRAITAIKWWFGYGEQKANEYLKTCNEDSVNALVEGYENNCKKMFVED